MSVAAARFVQELAENVYVERCQPRLDAAGKKVVQAGAQSEPLTFTAADQSAVLKRARISLDGLPPFHTA